MGLGFRIIDSGIRFMMEAWTRTWRSQMATKRVTHWSYKNVKRIGFKL